MDISLTQTSPFDNYAGQQQYVTVNTGSGSGSYSGDYSPPANPNPLTPLAGTNSAYSSSSGYEGLYIFLGVAALWYFDLI